MDCPKCGSDDIRVSHHAHKKDVFHHLCGQEAYRCRKCRHRFYGPKSALETKISHRSHRSSRGPRWHGSVERRAPAASSDVPCYVWPGVPDFPAFPSLYRYPVIFASRQVSGKPPLSDSFLQPAASQFAGVRRQPQSSPMNRSFSA